MMLFIRGFCLQQALLTRFFTIMEIFSTYNTHKNSNFAKVSCAWAVLASATALGSNNIRNIVLATFETP